MRAPDEGTSQRVGLARSVEWDAKRHQNTLVDDDDHTEQGDGWLPWVITEQHCDTYNPWKQAVRGKSREDAVTRTKNCQPEVHAVETLGCC